MLLVLVAFAGFFLENNYKTQTISLVRKRFKLFWFLAIRVKRAQFLVFYFIICQQLSWWSGHVGRNRVQWTRFLCLETESFGLVFCVRFLLERNSAAVQIEPSLLELLKTKIV